MEMPDVFDWQMDPVKTDCVISAVSASFQFHVLKTCGKSVLWMTAEPQWLEDSFCAQLDELRLLSSMYTSAEIVFLNGFNLLEFEQTVESGIFEGLADISEVSELMPNLKTPEFSLIVSVINSIP